MPSIITRPYGGILSLADAVEKYPSKRVLVYHRCSSGDINQTGGTLRDDGDYPKLRQVAYKVREEVRKIARLSRRGPFYAAKEEGKLTDPRMKLIEAAEYAKAHKEILCALNLSRFIRAEKYHRSTNIDAQPTRAEYAALRKLTKYVPLATLAPPEWTEAEQHSHRTKLSGNAGRPRKLTFHEWWKLLLDLGAYDTEEHPNQFDQSYRQVASKYGISRGAISQLLTKKIPGKTYWGQSLCLKDLMQGPGTWHVRRQTKDRLYDALEALLRKGSN